VRGIDDDFRGLIARHQRAEFASEQLRQAARALARMAPAMATSITCSLDLPPDYLPGFVRRASEIADEFGLALATESSSANHIRFTRILDPCGRTQSAGRSACSLTSR
jgi:hypothetical protein